MRELFRSKGFTIAFAALTLVAVLLLVLLIYLVFGKGAEALTTAVFLSSAAPEESVSVPEEHETESHQFIIRALTSSEEHSYPVMDEEIPETGILSIVKAGQNDEGITFHKLPQFDEASAEGNTVQNSGSYEIVSKIYVNSSGVAYPMYKTSAGYYVTSNKNYIFFDADSLTTEPDSAKKGVYGFDGTAGILLKIHSEDGNHLSFTIYTYTGNTETPVLDNVIAQYDDFGVAHFEFWNQSQVTTGSIVLRKESGSGLYIATVKFDEPIMIGGQATTEFEVRHCDK